MSPPRELLGRGSIYTLATFASMASVFLTMPLLTRLLAVNEFGMVALSVSVANLLGQVCHLSLPSVITRFYFFSEQGPGAAFGVSRGALVVTVAMVFLLGVTSALWWQPVTGHVWSKVALWTVLYAGALASVAIALALLRAQDRAWRFVATSVMSAVGGPVIGVVVLTHGPASADRYMFAVGAGSVLAAAVGLILAGSPFASGAFDGVACRSALAMSLPTVPHLLALQGYAVGGRVIINQFEGAAGVAEFHVAFTVGSLGIVLLAALNNAWAPLIYRAQSDGRERLLNVTTRTAVLLSATVSVVVVINSPWLLGVMAPGDYDRSALIGVATLTAMAAPIYAVYLANMHMVFVGGSTRSLAVTSPVAVGLTLLMLSIGATLVEGSIYVVGAGSALAYGLLALAGRRIARLQRMVVARQTKVLPALAGIAIVGGVAEATGAMDGTIRWIVMLGAGVPVVAFYGWLFTRSARSTTGGAGRMARFRQS